MRFEATHTSSDGSVHIIDFSLKPLRDDSDRIFLLIPEGRDITERIKAEEKIREREATIRAMVETSRDWIWSMDLSGVHTYSNPAVKEILGYEPREVTDLAIDLMHPDDRAAVQRHMPGWLREKKGWSNLPIRFRHKNGTWRYLESSAVPILDASGEITGFRGVDRDITDRRQAEDALRQSEATISSVLRTAPVGICIMHNRVYKSANRYWCEVFGYPEEDLIGRTTRMLYESDEEYERVGRELYPHLQEKGVRHGDETEAQRRVPPRRPS